MSDNLIPPALLGAVLTAAGQRDPLILRRVAVDLGVSDTQLRQEALRLARDPQVVAAHPRACRAILAKVDAGRRARDASLLGVRSEV